MVSVVAFILILSFLVIIHELGHYFAARWAKVKVEEFGLGYPPRAATLFTFKGTPFTLNWVPFGGFVRMEGEETSENQNSNEKDEKRSKTEKKAKIVDSHPFYTRSALQRLVVILAGVAVNFVFGIIAFAVVYSYMGIPTAINGARIESVATNSPADKAGIPSNVKIIGFTDIDQATGEPIAEQRQSIATNEAVKAMVQERFGKRVILHTSGPCDVLQCSSDEQSYTITIRTPEETPANEGAVGILFASQVAVHYPWYEQLIRGIGVGVQQALFVGYFILISLYELVKNLFQLGQLPSDVAGPVGIVHQAQTQGLFEQGPIMILNFMGLLSINLAIMNLLPIPALDGGRALFILLEGIVGKSRIQKIEGYANYGGFLALIGLIVLITARDIWKLFVR